MAENVGDWIGRSVLDEITLCSAYLQQNWRIVLPIYCSSHNRHLNLYITLEYKQVGNFSLYFNMDFKENGFVKTMIQFI